MIQELLREYNVLVTAEFERLLPLPPAGDLRRPLIEAMRYSLLGGGKRIRPALVFEFCRACGGQTVDALPAAVAIEMLHTYSLIHDDLPCMDDDDLRRGRPTLHRAFPEDTALLAGDALLTMAFEVLLVGGSPACAKAALVLAQAAGAAGMVGGQVMDLALEGGQTADLDTLSAMHAGKTGALIRAACVMGCLLGDAGEEQRTASVSYAENIGLAFQIKDDILDVSGDERTLGKPIGSDAKSEKTTFVSLMSLAEAQRRVEEHTERAKQAVRVFDEPDRLILLADYLAVRNF